MFCTPRPIFIFESPVGLLIQNENKTKNMQVLVIGYFFSSFFFLQAESEREEKYFNALEKKEQMQEKMNSVTEIKVTCYACRDVSGRF